MLRNRVKGFRVYVLIRDIMHSSLKHHKHDWAARLPDPSHTIVGPRLAVDESLSIPVRALAGRADFV